MTSTSISTDRYAVIGNPISQSKSPWIHSNFANQLKQDFLYEAIEGPLNGFADAVKTFVEAGGKGMNVTVPFKVQAFDLADMASDRAKAAGAVNCMKFQDGKIFVENFDGVGLVRDIVVNLQCELKGKRVLILGAGGATRGIVLPICEQGPALVHIVNRDLVKAQGLQEQFARLGPVSCGSYGELGSQKFDVVINATSASLNGLLPPLSAQQFSKTGLAYELVYGKGLTPFLQLAKEAGVGRLADGAGMLIEQAAEACFWWRGVRPATALLLEQLGRVEG